MTRAHFANARHPNARQAHRQSEEESVEVQTASASKGVKL